MTRLDPAGGRPSHDGLSRTASITPLGRTFRVRGPARRRAQAGPRRDRDGRDQRPAGRRGGAGDGRGLELRRLAGGRRRRRRACTGSCTSSPSLKTADALVVVAGMEGALPSVVGGLVDCPVIAVPTSIGYGAHFQGVAALLGMLNSCASNVVVVNIDAGFSGGHVASLIARRMGQARQTAAGPHDGTAVELADSSRMDAARPAPSSPNCNARTEQDCP